MTTQHSTDTKPKLTRPKQYVVKFLNDDFTPMDFVVFIMKKVFKMSADEAEKKMLEVHKNGQAVYGPMPHEIAETRVLIAQEMARNYEHPFRLDLEEA